MKKHLPPARPRSGRPVRPPKVALMIESSNSYARGLLGGVRDYLRAHGPWDVYLFEYGRGDRPPKWIHEWHGDGVLARVESKFTARALQELGVPVVDLSSHGHLPAAPVVTTDNARIARLAFEHFRARGFRHFAFCGDQHFAWSVARGGFFDELVRDAGLECSHYAEPHTRATEGASEIEALGVWLRGLTFPAAVFACYDARGQQILEACRRAGIAVPDELAVLGVDNDDLLCELAQPPLSSVIPNARGTGWEGAALLARLMRGRAVAPAIHRVPPRGVHTRQSTDTYAVEDAQLARALRVIREDACQGLTVAALLKKCPMSRRSLEQRLRAVLGRSPHEEIARVQIQRARELLTETELNLEEIASRSGFRNAQYLSVAFKRATGRPPSAFRQQLRT